MMDNNEEIVVGIARKLALWHTKTFRPIVTHDELEPIMATLGFVGMNPCKDGDWKEYRFEGRAAMLLDPSPHLRLPYPRIDGLHVHVYKAFCDSVALCLGSLDISDHFHVRGVPLHPTRDKPLDQFRRMYEDEGHYVYRDKTFDPSVPVIASVSFLTSLESNIRERTLASNHYNRSLCSFQVPLTDICYSF